MRGWFLTVVGVGLLLGGSGRAQSAETESDLLDAAAELSEEAEPVLVSMEFQGANLEDVLRSFSLQTGLNVIAAGDIAERPVTLYFEDVSMLDAFDQILQAGNLYYERPEGSDIYVVRPRTEQANTITRVYRLRYGRVSKAVLTQSIAAFGTVTPFESARVTSAATGEGGTPTATAASSSIGIDMVIEMLLSDQGSVVVDERTNTLIVTDVPNNFPRIEAAIVALDVRTTQILIDTEVLEVGTDSLKRLGADWNNSIAADANFGSRSSRFPFTWMDDRPGAGQATPFSLSTIAFDGGTDEISLVLNWLKSDTDTKVLARPKVLTLDNESATIRLSKNQTVGFEIERDADTGEVLNATPIRETTGVILTVTPQVNEQGFITMLVEPSVTKAVPSEIEPPAEAGTVLDPKTRASRTIVRVRDGDTLVVGGLVDREEDITEERVPWLSDIPVFGKLFRNTDSTINETELLVFLTPRIMADKVAATVAAKVIPEPVIQQAVESAAAAGAREQDTGGRSDAVEHALDRFGSSAN